MLPRALFIFESDEQGVSFLFAPLFFNVMQNMSFLCAFPAIGVHPEMDNYR